jgi:hypothetical protein
MKNLFLSPHGLIANKRSRSANVEEARKSLAKLG